MAGIVTSNKTRKLVGNRLKEIDVPTTTLNTALYYADLTAQGASFTAARVNAELNAYPTVVKNNASLAITPSANKAGVVYAMNGDSKTLEEFEFQRGSSGTYFDASGVMQLAEANMPRINYENGVSKGLLIEPASSNLFTDSGILNGIESFISKSSFGLTAVDTLFEKGILLSKGIRVSKEDSSVYAYKSAVIAQGTAYVVSAYIKMDDGSLPTNSDLKFMIQTVPQVSFGIENHGNGVYRIYKSFVGSSGQQTVGIAKTSEQSSKSFVITGFQLEQSSVLSSYIPTTSAVATRLADKVLSKRPTVVFPKNSMNVKTSEYPATWMGNGVDKLSISSKNLLLNSNSSNLFVSIYGSTLTNFGRVAVPEWNTANASRVLATGGTSILKASKAVIVPPNGEYASVSGWFKNNHVSNNIIVASHHGGKTATILPGQQLRVDFSNILGNGAGEIQLQIRTTDASHDADFSYWNLKSEKGSTITAWQPAPEDYVKVDINGNVEIRYHEPIHLQQFSLISRELSQEEV